MRTYVRSAIAVATALLALSWLAAPAAAWNRGPAPTFARLPAGSSHPEGIAVGPHGNVFVTTFDITRAAGPGHLLVYAPWGRLLRRVEVQGSSPLLLELAFHPQTGDLLVIDFGSQQVLTVDPVTGASGVFAVIPGGAAAGPNVLTFDVAGNVYVSDSFQGVIWRTGPAGGAVTAWASDPLLQTSGVPPFGANGLDFSPDGSVLYVANTGDDRVLSIPVNADGTAGTPAVFVNSINGADGLVVDEEGNLWVAANQADEIVVLDPSGRVIAKRGDFGGLTPRGEPVGLLFPASLVLDGPFVYVTNLSLDLRAFGLAQTVDAQWAAEVTTHTIARLPLSLPHVRGKR